MSVVTKYLFSLPLGFLILIVLWKGLSLHPADLPSTRIGKPVPAFSLPLLTDPAKQLTESIFLGKITLLNVWATTCEACEIEHPFLLSIANDPHFVLMGMEDEDSQTAGLAWLHQYGNPYAIILSDSTGDTAIDLGVYGTPETFVIDKKGIIRYRYTGAITLASWNTLFLPLIAQLENEK